MKIICIGRNYLDHIKELNNNSSEEPMFFLKPETAIQPKNHPFFIPDFSKDIQYEVELVIKINRAGKNIEKQFSHKYYTEIGLGIDFTARDLQEKCKKNGWPWEKAKAFDGSAQISKTFKCINELDISNIDFSLKKNDSLVQIGNSKHMLFNFDEIVSYVSKFFTLKIGDLIFTGTPAGVGKVKKEDVLQGFIGEEEMFRVKIK